MVESLSCGSAGVLLSAAGGKRKKTEQLSHQLWDLKAEKEPRQLIKMLPPILPSDGRLNHVDPPAIEDGTASKTVRHGLLADWKEGLVLLEL